MQRHQTSASVRWAAIGALAGVLATFALVAFALIDGQVWRLPAAALSVGASVIGSWYVLTRRGPPRLLGGLIAVGGVALFLVIVFTGPHKGLLVAAAIVLGIASSLAGGFALSSADEPPGESSMTTGSPAAAPRRAVLLMNPKSGGGKVGRYDLPERCLERGIEAMVLSPDDDLATLARKAVDGGADIIGMAGGDGSQALVASVAAQHNIPFVCIPAGTRNHLALDLGIDREDLVGALEGFQSGIERRIDLATVNGRIFVNNASMGLYAKIVQSPAYRDAKLKTAADMLPDLLGPEAEPFDLRFLGPDGTQWPYAHMLLVSNDPYQLDQLMGSGKRPKMDTGCLGMAAARIDGPAAAVSFIALESAGRLRTFKGWLEWEAPTFRVHSTAPVEVGLDGEAMVLEPPLVFESLPSVLRVGLPTRLTRGPRTPNAVHLTPETVASLISVAAGRR